MKGRRKVTLKALKITFVVRLSEEVMGKDVTVCSATNYSKRITPAI